MSVMQEFYPGSKTPRGQVVVIDQPLPKDWDAKPIKGSVGGKEIEFFSIGALAQALNRAVVSIRLWEKNGYIPTAPFRQPDHKGGKGDRLYTRSIIEATIQEFDKRGLLAPRSRVRWETEHKDLTIALFERWAFLVENKKYN